MIWQYAQILLQEKVRNSQLYEKIRAMDFWDTTGILLDG
jgi:hypothetical protein